MRVIAALLALVIALPATAQTATSQSDMEMVTRMLGAIWRPLPSAASGRNAAETACAGVEEEMNALNDLMPDDLTSPAVSSIRATRGFVIVNTADPGVAFFFPSAQLNFIASGPGRFAIADRTRGAVTLTDAAGAVTQVQLGAADGLPLMRILRQNELPLTYIGCASTGG